MAIVKISDGKAVTIANAIDKELTALDLNYKTLSLLDLMVLPIWLVISEMYEESSQRANKDVLYIHCKAHILSLTIIYHR